MEKSYFDPIEIRSKMQDLNAIGKRWYFKDCRYEVNKNKCEKFKSLVKLYDKAHESLREEISKCNSIIQNEAYHKSRILQYTYCISSIESKIDPLISDYHSRFVRLETEFNKL